MSFLSRFFLLPSICLFMIMLSSANANTKDGELQYSIGTGYPYVLIPQVAFKDGEMSFFLNYKVGLDDGFTAGINLHDEHHLYGVFIGAVGARKSERRCESDCPILDFRLSEQESTQGLGLSYEYRFTPNAASSWALRAEVGYGKESFNNDKRADANLQILYHF